MSFLLILAFVFPILASSESPDSVPLEGGSLFVHDLAHTDVKCAHMPVPEGAGRVRALVDKISRDPPPSNSGGYHIIDEDFDVQPGVNRFYLCISTFGTQGTDFLLTAAISDSGIYHLPPLKMRLDYPLIWKAHGLRSDSFFEVTVPADISAEDPLVLTVNPLTGEADIECRDSRGKMLAVSDAIGPDRISLTSSIPGNKLLIKVKAKPNGSSVFSLAVAKQNVGPFAAQSIPIVGQLDDKDGFAKFRVLFNRDTDVSIVARPLASSANTKPPRLTASLSGTAETWSSETGMLEIERGEIVKQISGAEETIFVTVAARGSRDSVGPFILMVVTSSTVTLLADGQPQAVAVKGKKRFRDFKVWIPFRANFVLTIEGDTSADSSGLAFWADTTRYSHDPRGYRWSTMEKEGNFMYLTTIPALAKGPVHLIDCDLCYVYVTVLSCTYGPQHCEDTGESKYLITATSDSSGELLLGEGRASRMLIHSEGKNGGKVFKYLLPSAVSEDSKQSSGKYLVQAFGDVPFFLTLSSSSSFEAASQPVACPAKERCVVGIKPEDPLRKSKDGLFVKIAPEPGSTVDVEVLVREQDTPQSLRNHQVVVGDLNNFYDKFRMFVPAQVHEDHVTLLISTSTESASLVTKVCPSVPDADLSTGAGDRACVTRTGSGNIEMSTGDLASAMENGGKWVVITVTCPDACKYEMRSDLFLASNSLRLNGRGVPATIEAMSKRDWQVGTREGDEWSVSVSTVGPPDGIKICVEPQGCVEGLPASIQGFGRQTLQIINSNEDKKAAVHLVGFRLVSLRVNEWISVDGRSSSIFKLPSNLAWVRVDVYPASASVLQGKALPLPGKDAGFVPVQKDSAVDSSAFGFVKVEGAQHVRVAVPFHLHVNEWAEGPPWVSWSESQLEQIVLVERCNLVGQSGSVTANGTDIGTDGIASFLAKDQGALILATTAASENSFPTHFRVGIFPREPREVEESFTKAGLPAIDIVMTPKNAAGSLYRAVCAPNPKSLEFTSCEIQHSPGIVAGDWQACAAEARCTLPLPRRCPSGSAVGAFAEQGPSHGIFAPLGGGRPAALGMRGQEGGWGWMWWIAILGVIYCIAGTFINAYTTGAAISDAIPHIDWLRLNIWRLQRSKRRYWRAEDDDVRGLGVTERGKAMVEIPSHPQFYRDLGDGNVDAGPRLVGLGRDVEQGNLVNRAVGPGVSVGGRQMVGAYQPPQL